MVAKTSIVWDESEEKKGEKIVLTGVSLGSSVYSFKKLLLFTGSSPLTLESIRCDDQRLRKTQKRIIEKKRGTGVSSPVRKKNRQEARSREASSSASGSRAQEPNEIGQINIFQDGARTGVAASKPVVTFTQEPSSEEVTLKEYAIGKGKRLDAFISKFLVSFREVCVGRFATFMNKNIHFPQLGVFTSYSYMIPASSGQPLVHGRFPLSRAPVTAREVISGECDGDMGVDPQGDLAGKRSACDWHTFTENKNVKSVCFFQLYWGTGFDSWD